MSCGTMLPTTLTTPFAPMLISGNVNISSVPAATQAIAPQQQAAANEQARRQAMIAAQAQAQAADLEFVASNARAGTEMIPAVTWIGHATMLVQAGGLTVLTDPIFSARASPVPFAGPSRAQAPGIALQDLPHIDVVLISHNHYDHLDRSSVKALASNVAMPTSMAA